MPILASKTAVRDKHPSRKDGCRNCGLYLIRRCYVRHWWFRLAREPLVWGMRMLAWCNGLTAWKELGYQPECRGCVRFLKTELEETSPTYRFLNRFIGPRFKVLRDSMLNPLEFAEAKRIASEAVPQSGSHGK